jgi:hypothetical protein
MLNYHKSKIIANGNKFRVAFTIASSISIFDDKGALFEKFFACDLCRTEKVNSGYPQFVKGNKAFTPVFGIHHGIVFRSSLTTPDDEYRRIFKAEDMLGGYCVYGVECEGESLKLCDAIPLIKSRKFLVAQTEIDLSAGGRAVIEYPIRTVNFSDTGLVQVDTGPVIVPLMRAKQRNPVEYMRLAHVAFHEENIVEFIVEEVTDVCDCKIKRLEYSNSIVIKNVKNRIIAC